MNKLKKKLVDIRQVVNKKTLKNLNGFFLDSKNIYFNISQIIIPKIKIPTGERDLRIFTINITG